VSPELQNWLLQSAVAWYCSWKILACHGSCKLDLLQLAVDAVLVDGSSCLATAVAVEASTGAGVPRRASIGWRINRGDSSLFDSADTAAYVLK